MLLKSRQDLNVGLAVEAMNRTMNCDGLVQSLMILGILQRFPTVHSKATGQSEGMNAMDLVSREMEIINEHLCF